MRPPDPPRGSWHAFFFVGAISPFYLIYKKKTGKDGKKGIAVSDRVLAELHVDFFFFFDLG